MSTIQAYRQHTAKEGASQPHEPHVRSQSRYGAGHDAEQVLQEFCLSSDTKAHASTDFILIKEAAKAENPDYFGVATGNIC